MAKTPNKIIRSGNKAKSTQTSTPVKEATASKKGTTASKTKRSKTQAAADRDLKVKIDADARDLMYDKPGLSLEEARSEIIARRYKLDDPSTVPEEDTYEAREAAVDPNAITSADTGESRISDTTEFSDLENTGENAQTENYDPTNIRVINSEEGDPLGELEKESNAYLTPEERVAKLDEKRAEEEAGPGSTFPSSQPLPRDLSSTSPLPGRSPRRSLFSRRRQVAQSYADTLGMSEDTVRGKLDSRRRDSKVTVPTESILETPTEGTTEAPAEGTVTADTSTKIYDSTDPRIATAGKTPEQIVRDLAPGSPRRTLGGGLVLGRRFRGTSNYNKNPGVVEVNEDNATRALIGNADLAIQNAMTAARAGQSGPATSGKDLTVGQARLSPQLRGVLQAGSMGGVLSTQQGEDVTQLVGSFADRDSSTRTSGTMPADEADAASRAATQVVPKVDENGRTMMDPNNPDVPLTALATPRVAPRPAAFPEEGLALPSIFGGQQFRMTAQFLQKRNDIEAAARARATSGEIKDADFATSELGKAAAERKASGAPLPHTMVPNPAYVPVDEQGMPYEEGPDADAARIDTAKKMARGSRSTGRSFRFTRTGRKGESRSRDFVGEGTPGVDEYYPTKSEKSTVTVVVPGTGTRQNARDAAGNTILDKNGRPVPMRDAEGKPITTPKREEVREVETGRQVADYGPTTAVGPAIAAEATAALRESNGGMTEEDALEGADLYTAAEDETQKSYEYDMIHQGQNPGISDHGEVSTSTSAGKNPLPKDVTARKALIPGTTGGTVQADIIDPNKKVNKKVFDSATQTMVNAPVSQLLEHITAGVTDPAKRDRIAAGLQVTTNDSTVAAPKEDEFGVEIDDQGEDINPLDTGIDTTPARAYTPAMRQHPLTGTAAPELQNTGRPRKDKVAHEAALAEWTKYNTVDKSPEAIQRARDLQQASRVAERDQNSADRGNSVESLTATLAKEAAERKAIEDAKEPEAIAAAAAAAKDRAEANKAATAKRVASANTPFFTKEELDVAAASNRTPEEVVASPGITKAESDAKQAERRAADKADEEAGTYVGFDFAKAERMRTRDVTYPLTLESGESHPSAGQPVRTRSGAFVKHDSGTQTPQFDASGAFTHLEPKTFPRPAYEQKVEPQTLSRISKQDRFRIDTANKILESEGKPAVVATGSNRGVLEPGVSDHDLTFGAVPGIVPTPRTVPQTVTSDTGTSMDISVNNPDYSVPSGIRVGQPASTNTGVSSSNRPITTRRQEAYAQLRRRPGQPLEGQPMPSRREEGVIVPPTGYINPAITRAGATPGTTESRPATLIPSPRAFDRNRALDPRSRVDVYDREAAAPLIAKTIGDITADGTTYVRPDATPQPISTGRRVSQPRYGPMATDTPEETQTRINSAMGGSQFTT